MSEKSLFIQGILLTGISLLNQQPIAHVLREWAKVAPHTLIRPLRSAQQDRSDCLLFSMQKTSADYRAAFTPSRGPISSGSAAGS